MGLKPSTNLEAIKETDDDDDETWIGGVSAISLNYDEDWCDEGVGKEEVDCLASAISSKVGRKSLNGIKKKISCEQDKIVYTNDTLVLEYVLCQWKDLNLNDRVSVQFCMESGIDSHKKYLTRVSSSSKELVIDKEMSLDSRSAVNSLLVQFVPDKEKDVDAYLKKILKENPLMEIHPKLLAYKLAVSEVTNRSNTKKIVKSCRIPLPVMCRPTFAVKDDGCNLFFGKKNIVHKDGSV